MLWRTAIFRATALPLLVIGTNRRGGGTFLRYGGGTNGRHRGLIARTDGRLAIIGRGRNAFSPPSNGCVPMPTGVLPTEALTRSACDKLGCIGHLAGGKVIALVLDRAAFAEDCTRADIVVTPLFAPIGCAAGIVIDRDKLKGTGALTFSFAKDDVRTQSGRAADEDRPWSPAPKRGWGRAAPPAPANDKDGQAGGEEPEPAGESGEPAVE